MYRPSLSVNTKGNDAFCIVASMSKDNHQHLKESGAHERLRDARKKAGYKSASEAARHFGWTDSTYRHHENGTRGIKRDEMKKYSSAYRVPIDWLLFGRTAGAAVIPVLGDVGPGGIVREASREQPVEMVEGPPDMRKDAAAIKIMGDSMYPRYLDGDILVYKQNSSFIEASGRECLVELSDGTKMLRIMHMNNGVVTLDGINTPPLHDASVAWVAPISWVKRK